MTLIVEDGTMPEGANTFASAEDTDAYLTPRGLWVMTPEVDGVPDDGIVAKKEKAIIRATDYLNTLEWCGVSVVQDRVMSWPRDGVLYPDGVAVPAAVVPLAVKTACMELAAIVYAGEDILAPVAKDDRLASKTVGPISKSWFEGTPDETLFPAVASLIAMFLKRVPGGLKTGSRCVEAQRG